MKILSLSPFLLLVTMTCFLCAMDEKAQFEKNLQVLSPQSRALFNHVMALSPDQLRLVHPYVTPNGGAIALILDDPAKHLDYNPMKYIDLKNGNAGNADVIACVEALKYAKQQRLSSNQ
jgi:hypothetical protein